ncbi:tannase/feruloyl esterase family alpha/beta hydrolase [Aquincola sp. MAHUQ-54]|uniref:Tannase/feruloyl esterase family alpha/beta hydrolase n=1 Tax=Aquincola agrisoli TaxID=3119538 RepID=A0AAW9QCB5_9BURK
MSHALPPRHCRPRLPLHAVSMAVAATLLAACGGNGGDDDDDTPAPPVALNCDDTLKSHALASDTTILDVKAFAKDAPLTGAANAPTAAADLCRVKLVVGPGNPGPADAPSTSSGIGVELWLPAKAAWNQKYVAVGGGGWQGGTATKDPAALASALAAQMAGQGYVSSFTDTGHDKGGSSGSFGMLPDGSINHVLLKDNAERSLVEMAAKSKAMAAAYFGSGPTRNYWLGCSTGGRQGMMMAQRHPEVFDGIVAGAPAFNWDRFHPAQMWPQIVMQQDLGGPIAGAKLTAATAAAVAACGSTLTGQADGFIEQPGQCTYDPAQDAALLCTSAGGSNNTASCLTLAEASALNKIWHGPTQSGEVPAPARDNGFNLVLQPNQLWYGLTRGTNLASLAGTNPFGTGADHIAIVMQDPSYGSTSFTNATGNGQNRVRNVTYGGVNSFYAMYSKSVALTHEVLGTDSPDLSAFKARGGKLVMFHGLSDPLIFPQGTLNYYERLAGEQGGYAGAQAFARLYMMPGLGHCSGAGTPGATPRAPNGNVASPQMEFFSMMVDWVEKGTAPAEAVPATTAANVTPARSRPLCMYPKQAAYLGGDVNAAASYACR